MNRLREENGNIFTKISKKLLSKEDRKAIKAKGLKLTKANIEAFLKEKDEKAKEEARIKDEEAKRKAEEDRKNNPTVEDLLKDIKAILSEKK